MVEVSTAITYSHACIATAQQMHALFEADPLTVERVSARALFCRCIDHFRGTVLLAEQELDAEALTLVRGIIETSFVIGALLKGVLTTSQLQAFDQAAKGKGARALADFLRRAGRPDVQELMRDFGKRHTGPTLQIEELAKMLDEQDMYNGHYRMLSNKASHPSLSSVEKYLDYGDPRSTSVRYPGNGHPPQWTVLIGASIFLHTCAGVERWLGTTTREINQAIKNRLEELEAFGPMSEW
jgi:hypothetical protein